MFNERTTVVNYNFLFDFVHDFWTSHIDPFLILIVNRH